MNRDDNMFWPFKYCSGSGISDARKSPLKLSHSLHLFFGTCIHNDPDAYITIAFCCPFFANLESTLEMQVFSHPWQWAILFYFLSALTDLVKH